MVLPIRLFIQTSRRILLTREPISSQNLLYFTRTLSTKSLSNQKTQSENPNWNQSENNYEDEKPDKYAPEVRNKAAYNYSLLIGSLIGVFGSSYVLYKRNGEIEAKSIDSELLKDEGVGEEVAKEEDYSKSLHKSQAGFKERKIIEYENRVRVYSTPDKIFRYFATLQDGKTSEIYMTPEDFVRALTPDTMQPLGLGLDQFKKIDLKQIGRYKSQHFGEDSIFHCFGDGGLISFSDYVFLLTVLGTSARHIGIAFRMFDLNGDGEVTADEFKMVQSLFLSMTTTGSRHRDRKTTGNVLHANVNSGLSNHFFQEDGSKKLTTQEFVDFKSQLQKEVMFLEFKSFNPENEIITEVAFAELLITYANFTGTKRQKILKRIKKLYPSSGENKAEGVCFDDYLDFFNILLNVRDIDMALSFHTVAGQTIDKVTFKQVAKTVANIQLRDHLVDVVFSIFDENEDGFLSNREFISVMKDKCVRGLNKPKDTGFTRFLSAVYSCAKSNIAESWATPKQTH